MGTQDMELSEIEKRNSEFFSRKEALDQYSRFWLFPVEKRIFERHLSGLGRVLDVGCGCGRTSRYLRDMGHTVTAIDVVPEMLDIARELVTGVDFRWMDACSLEFENMSFDYVLFSYNGMDGIYPEGKRKACLKEIYRVLRPGGGFVFSSHNAASLKSLFPTNRFRLVNLLLNLRKRRMFQPYRLEIHPSGTLELYTTTLYRQKRELWDAGFRSINVYGQEETQGTLRTYLLDLWCYYVCFTASQ